MKAVSQKTVTKVPVKMLATAAEAVARLRVERGEDDWGERGGVDGVGVEGFLEDGFGVEALIERPEAEQDDHQAAR